MSCWCKLFMFSCCAVRIYDGGNIGSNFVKCYECCFLLHVPALITKMISPDGIRTKTDALYSLAEPPSIATLSLSPFHVRLMALTVSFIQSSTKNLVNNGNLFCPIYELTRAVCTGLLSNTTQ